jgi:thiamine-phosphate pyrophosphorylase
MIVGKTIHSVLELEELNLLGNEIDYFGIGPLNSTSTKNDAPRPLGWAGINTIVLKAKALYPSIPIAIIGGITLDDLDEFCVQSKILEGLNYIDSFAVSGDIAKSVNPKEKVEKFIIKIKQINDLKNKR